MTFAVQPVEIGANQVPIPIGDATLVTCGPFECAMGTEVPELSVANSPVCAAWDPELELQVGLIDNDVVDRDDDQDDVNDEEGFDDTADDGIDLGWVTSSSAVMTVKHIFEGVPNGENYTVSGPDSAKGSDEPLKMSKRTDDNNMDTENIAYRPGILIDRPGADPPGPPPEAKVADAEAVSACVEEGTYAETVGANHQPDNCFRVRVGGDATAKNPKLSNYLDGYTVEVAAADSEVAWGKVEWDPDPFEDLECESMTFMAADQLDVCAMFEDEVDQAVAAGWAQDRSTRPGGVSFSRTARTSAG